MECAGDYDTHGCYGGLASHAFEYLTAAGGVAAEKDYNYIADKGIC